MPRITHMTAREVFDSRGRPTVEVVVTCAGGRPCRAITPAGASTGAAEAAELRDGGNRLGGWGVRRAVENVRTEIANAFVGCDAADQALIDQRLIDLDGTPNKSRLGANAILAVSLASAYAAASTFGRSPIEHFQRLWKKIPSTLSSEAPAAPASATSIGAGPSLPLPMVNMISGGKHAGGQLDFQDFLLMPVGATSFSQGLEWIITVYQTLGRVLNASGYEGTLVGDEGGYGPRLQSNQEALDLIIEAIQRAGYRPGDDLAFAIDVASTHFYRDGFYHLAADGGRRLSSQEMIASLVDWVDHYPILSIEDGLAEEDWEGWQALTSTLAERVQLIGDDLFATNVNRLQRGIDLGAGNSVLIKLNQIGTLTETLQTMRLAVDHGYAPVISARSGETEDVTIADLAVATGAGQIKIGSVARSERLVKYNQLLRWEEELNAPYVGSAALYEAQG
ncbi:MAG: phosphopyruvate hydratase [Planctomycetaceae bacterium]|nr:phosphopyruvate hydratase [Planctomycetaceae bacterium]